MAMGTVGATVGGASKNVIVAVDGNNSVAPGHVEVDANGSPLSAANPKPVAITSWGSSLATGQVTVGTSPTQIAAARAGRRAVTIVQEGTTLMRLGTSSVSINNGVPLPGVQYATFTFEGGAAIYGIVASGSQVVSYAETF